MKGLGQLAADWSAADHCQPWRQFGQRKDRLVGQIASFGQAGDVRGRSARPAADGGLFEPQLCTGHRYALGTHKAGIADKHVDPELIPKASRRVVVANVGPNTAHPFHGAAKIAPDRIPAQYAECSAAAGIVQGAGGTDQPL